MSHRKLPTNVSPHSQPGENEYGENNNINESEEEEEQLGEEEDDEEDDGNNIHPLEKDADDNEDREEDDADANGGGDENCDGEDDDDNDKQKSYIMEIDDDLERQPKKQKLKSLISAYEFAPRVPAPSAAAPSAPKPSSGGRNPLTDWTEHETFVLLDVWGDRFLQHGRKSLRSEEWQEVAEKVSKVSRVDRTDSQCRNRLDTLKKKYKKEKIKFSETDGGTSNWVYFKRMDKLMCSPPQQAGLSCGLDGEYVSMNSRIYSNRANGLDETRDSPGNTESTEEGSDGPHAKKRRKGRGSCESSSFRLLADSLHKFSNIYEKIEDDRRQQMVELEKMRMDFQKEIETERRQILERLQSEISKLEQTDDENDGSSENGM
ncbi:putative transcription factor MYB family [Lupinus albus]|uniref:Putative transcription factor MYB family n=1 Tax=Lupinus albus TaxID=3870 RepID=A0A6A4N2U1_LUPAL|nr:putative transcription factor MYB family [Lupinus albus]